MHKGAAQPGGVALRRPKSQLTVEERVQWLGELARAVDEAQQIVWGLCQLRGDNPHFNEIYGRLEAARDEIERLQRHAGRSARVELHRDWSELMAKVSACAGAID